MTDPVDLALRTTFDEDAELYDRVRPRYPSGLFDDLAVLAGVGPGCRLLEIGAGTGIATVPLARRGCRIVAVEHGANMAAMARRVLAGFPEVQVVVSAFEAWPPPAEPFDVVLAATAYHWLDPRVRVAKIADALRPGGALAVVETHHVAGGTQVFFDEVQRCYEQFDPNTTPGLRLPTVALIPARAADIETDARFEPPVFRRHEWEVTYPTGRYLDLLLSYSGHRALPTLAALLDCIGTLIDTRYGGQITKRYLIQLWVARRRT